MQIGSNNRPSSGDGADQRNDCGKEQSRTVKNEVELVAGTDSSNKYTTTDNIPNDTAHTNTVNENEERLEPPALETPEESSRHCSLVGISPLSNDLVVDEEFNNEANMPVPEPDLDFNGSMLEVDDEEAEQAESIYNASHSPAIPIRYRTEHFDAATIISSSRSLYAEDLDYVLENGRRYCGDYIFPNDELEQDRLRVMHQVYLQIFDLKLTSVPLHDPQYILDIGTGTGEWAISMGETFLSCEVIGVDISAIQPSAVPENVFFEIDDCEIEWTRPNDTFDLVHLRDMAGAIADWDFVYREALACLKPGSYIEVLDFHDHTGMSDTFLSCFPPEAEIHSFARAVDEASIKAGRRRGTHHLDVERLQEIGFVDARCVEKSIPLNPHVGSIARLWLIACLHTVEAGSLRLLTKYLGWEPAKALATCNKVCQEIKAKALDPSVSSVLEVSLIVLTARKPTAEELASGRASNEPELPSFLNVENVVAARNEHSEDEGTIGG